jgi:hypothetical protein
VVPVHILESVELVTDLVQLLLERFLLSLATLALALELPNLLHQRSINILQLLHFLLQILYFPIIEGLQEVLLFVSS